MRFIDYISVLNLLRENDAACERFCRETLSVSISVGSEVIWPRAPK